MNVHNRWLSGLSVGVVIMILVLALVGGSASAQSPPPPPGESLATDLGLMQIQMSSDHFRLYWNVIGSGGSDMTSTHFRLSSTIGQPTVGVKSSTHYGLCDGFWCAVGHFIRTHFLPMVSKGN